MGGGVTDSCVGNTEGHVWKRGAGVEAPAGDQVRDEGDLACPGSLEVKRSSLKRDFAS